MRNSPGNIARWGHRESSAARGFLLRAGTPSFHRRRLSIRSGSRGAARVPYQHPSLLNVTRLSPQSLLLSSFQPRPTRPTKPKIFQLARALVDKERERAPRNTRQRAGRQAGLVVGLDKSIERGRADRDGGHHLLSLLPAATFCGPGNVDARVRSIVRLRGLTQRVIMLHIDSGLGHQPRDFRRHQTVDGAVL
jgi:hypothetical protein